MGRVCFFFFSVFSVAALSEPTELEMCAYFATSLNELGVDNNSVDYEMLSFKQFSARYPNKTLMPVEPRFSKLKKLAKDCVFFEKGAYGDHLTPKEDDLFAYLYAKFLAKKWNSLVFYRVEGNHLPGGGLESPNCAMVIGHEGQLLIMQGSTMD